MDNIQSPPPEDPRIYFAAERTLLAWIRTGLSIIGFGFIVAKFGGTIPLKMVPQPGGGYGGGPTSFFSSQLVMFGLGVGIVFLGALTMLVGSWQQRVFVASNPLQGKRSIPFRNFSCSVAFILGLLGLALGVYLLSDLF